MVFFKITHFFLIILVISLAFHSPINNTAFAANGDIITEVASSVHETGTSEYHSLIQLDSDTYVLAYTDADGDGFIQTFTISADGKTITEVSNSEHNTGDGTHHSAVMVDSDTYLVAYASTAVMGKISTHTISADGTITASNIVKYEHETNKATYNSLVKVDSDTYALAYTGAGEDGHIQTFTVAADGSSIDKVENVEHDTADATYNSFVQVDSDTYALAYTGTDGDGYISTFTIDADGTNITEVDTLEHDVKDATHNSFVQVDSDTYALAYTGTDGDGYISTFTIDADGTNITEVKSSEHDTNRAIYNSLVKVDSDIYALAYTGINNVGYISTFTINADGTNITEVKSSEHDTNDAIYNSLVKVDSDTYALAYANTAGAGSISTFTISSSSATSRGGGNNCDSNGFGNNSSLRVYEVSYDVDSNKVQIQAYSTCGSISAKMTTPTQQSMLSLSMDQPLLDDRVVVYSGFLDESDEKFNISVQNKRDSFSETFYIYDKSISKSYTGETGYTSEQQGIFSPTITATQTTILSEPSITTVSQTIEELIPLEKQIIAEKLVVDQTQSMQYTPEPIAEETTEQTCGIGTESVNGICKIIIPDEPQFCFLFWCW